MTYMMLRMTFHLLAAAGRVSGPGKAALAAAATSA